MNLRSEFNRCAREWLGEFNDPHVPLETLLVGTPLENVNREFWIKEWGNRKHESK